MGTAVPPARSLELSRAVRAFLAVCILLAVCFGTAYVSRPGIGEVAAPGRPSVVPVTGITAVCPDVSAWAAGSATTVTTVVLPHDGAAQGSGTQDGQDDGAVQDGKAVLSTLAGEELAASEAHGSAVGTDFEAAEGKPVVGRALGAFAPGYSVDMVTRVPARDHRGLAGGACVAPGSSFWFLAGGSSVGRRGQLYLTNSDAWPAQVDVTLWSDAGPVDAPAGKGIAVPAGEQRQFLLDALAPGHARLAVHVATRSGRIAAALRQQEVDGLTPRGTDWVPPAVAPSRNLVVPGLPGGGPGGDAAAFLRVAAPGDTNAVVKLQIAGDAGVFAPAGLDILEVQAGTVADFEVTGALDGKPAGLLLTSDTPVTAGAEIRLGAPDGVGELAYTAAVRPLLDAPGVAGYARTKDPSSSQLVLTSGEDDVTVAVTALVPGRTEPTPVGEPVTIGPYKTAVVPLSVEGADRFAAVVTPKPGSGPVYAAHVLTEQADPVPLITVLPLRPAPVTVSLPPVHPALVP